MIRTGIFSALALALAAPAVADVMTAFPSAAATAGHQLSDSERDAYTHIFQSIRAGDYQAAANGLAALPSGVLTPIARAELMLASPDARDPDAVTALLALSPDLPEGLALAKYAPSGALLPGVTCPTRTPSVVAGKFSRARSSDVSGSRDMPTGFIPSC